MNIKNKIMFMIIFLSILISSLSGMVGFSVSKQALLDQFRTQVQYISELKEYRLEYYLKDNLETLSFLATSNELKDYFGKYHQKNVSPAQGEIENEDDEAAESLDELAAEEIISSDLALATKYSDFMELQALALDGIVDFSTNPLNKYKDVSYTSYFKNGLTRPSVDPVYYSYSEHQPMMSFSAPIISDEGVVVGVIVGHVNMSHLNSIVARPVGPGLTGEAYLVSSGYLLLTESRFLPNVSTKKSIYTAASRKCLETKGKGSLDGLGYRNEPVVGYYRWLPEFNACLLVEIDTIEAYAPMNNLARALTFLIVIVALISIVLAIIFSQSITIPLKKLMSGVSQVSSGKLDVAIKINSTDELGDLAHSFNRMTSELSRSKKQLQTYADSLEKQVAARTDELKSKVRDLENSKRAMLNILEDVNASKQSLEQHRAELMHLNRKLHKAVAELKKMDVYKNDFISITAHELKTPMSSIIGFATMLQDRKIVEHRAKRVSYLKIILEDAKRLKKLVDDILDVSRLELGTMKFFFEKADISALFSGVERELSVLAKSRKLKLATSIEKNVPKELIVDKFRLSQVLINLANNAIKFTPEGGKPIVICARKNGSTIVFSVKDSGVGIAKQDLKKLFKRFSQVDSSYTRKVGGTGLGLSISKGIVEAMGGKIWVKSMPKEGSTFFFSLPIRTDIPDAGNLSVVNKDMIENKVPPVRAASTEPAATGSVKDVPVNKR